MIKKLKYVEDKFSTSLIPHPNVDHDQKHKRYFGYNETDRFNENVDHEQFQQGINFLPKTEILFQLFSFTVYLY